MTNLTTTEQPAIGAELLPSTETIESLWKLCQRLITTGFLPEAIKTPEQAMACALKGRELGLPPMMSWSSIYIVRGKVELSASLMAAMLRRGGVRIEEHETSDVAAELTFHRGEDEKAHVRFTMEDAKKAGLVKDNWRKWPRQLLYARAVSEGARRIGPDLIHGAYVQGEVGGQDPEAPPEVEEIRQAEIVEPVAPAPEKPAKKATKKATKKAKPSNGDWEHSAAADGKKPSGAQIKKLFAMVNKHPDFEPRDDSESRDDIRKWFVRGVTKQRVSSSKEMTKAEVAKAIDVLESDGNEVATFISAGSI